MCYDCLPGWYHVTRIHNGTVPVQTEQGSKYTVKTDRQQDTEGMFLPASVTSKSPQMRTTYVNYEYLLSTILYLLNLNYAAAAMKDMSISLINPL